MIEIKFKIFRFDPEVDREPYYKKYTVKAEPRERLLDCLNRIKWEQDGTFKLPHVLRPRGVRFRWDEDQRTMRSGVSETR